MTTSTGVRAFAAAILCVGGVGLAWGANLAAPTPDMTAVAAPASTTSTTITIAPTTTSTLPASTTTTSSTTTVVSDPALFVSIDFPTNIVVGTTVRFDVTCSRPLRSGDNAAIYITGPGEDLGTLIAGQETDGDPTVTITVQGDGFIVDWTVPPAFPPSNSYQLAVDCTGPQQPIQIDPLPDGAAGPVNPIAIVASQPIVTETLPETD